MPRLILAVLFLLALFVVLCGPVLAVALRLRRQGHVPSLRPLRAVWLAQIVVACTLLFVADAAGVPNPAGWMAAILACVSLVGAALFAAWAAARRLLAR